jgi:hypothetical protein
MLQCKNDSFRLTGNSGSPGGVGDASAFGLSADIEVCWSSCAVEVIEDVVSLFEGCVAVIVEVVDILIDPILLHGVEDSAHEGVVVLPS